MAEQPSEAVYWCHHCEAFLTRAMAVTQPATWLPGAPPRLACPHCGDDFELGALDISEQPCALKHALAGESMYPGDCRCPEYVAWDDQQRAEEAARERARRSEAAKRAAATRRRRRG